MISSSFFSQQSTASLSVSNATPHPIQPTVLAMCQAVIPPTNSSSENNNDWFLKLIGQPQPVIVAPPPRAQSSPISSRRAVRIQIINKHDDISLPPPSLLPIIPSPLSSSSVTIDESTPTLADYLANNGTIFNIPNDHQGLAPIIEDITGKFIILFQTNISIIFSVVVIGYEQLQDASNNNLMDLDQPYDVSGWIDTPLSNFGTNSVDIMSTYDFLCL
jgi:hypothetical protein